MRTKAHEFETAGVRLAINQNEIGADVAAPEILPVPGERMISIVAWQRGVGRKQCHGFCQLAIELLDVPAGVPGLLAFVIALKCVGVLKRDDFSLNRHRALSYCWSMIFSENRYPLFGIML
jgi:hypothetical protein